MTLDDGEETDEDARVSENLVLDSPEQLRELTQDMLVELFGLTVRGL